MLAWLIWLLVAQIHLYEVSDPIQINGEPVVTASFSPEATESLERGQIASLMLDGRIGAEIGTVPAVVLEVNNNLAEDTVSASILIYWDDVDFGSIPFESNLEGQIQIEVEQISPITLIMRSAQSAINAESSSTQDNTVDEN